MPGLENKIREEAARLLREKIVERVIGFTGGSLLMRATPYFVFNEKDADQLIWNSFCDNNLAKYLLKSRQKTAILAKGCDSRAIIELIKEKQIDGEQLFIIGVACQGMVNRRRVERRYGPGMINKVDDSAQRLIIDGSLGRVELSREDYLYPSCQVCHHKNPVRYDILIGEPVVEKTDDYADVTRFASLPAEERWRYLSSQMDQCIRCYACRNSCPLCYCPDCFVDSTNPCWLGKTDALSDNFIFHITRAFHLAGRCVECGACERACPLALDIRKLHRKLAADVKELFDYRSGTDTRKPAPLSSFKVDDSQDFLLNLNEGEE